MKNFQFGAVFVLLPLHSLPRRRYISVRKKLTELKLFGTLNDVVSLKENVKLHMNKQLIGHDFREIWWLLKEPFACVDSAV